MNGNRDGENSGVLKTVRRGFGLKGLTMKEIKCAHCGKILSRLVDKGNQFEGYYLYLENAYCSECWDKNETDVLVLSKNAPLIEMMVKGSGRP